MRIPYNRRTFPWGRRTGAHRVVCRVEQHRSAPPLCGVGACARRGTGCRERALFTWQGKGWSAGGQTARKPVPVETPWCGRTSVLNITGRGI